MSLSPGNIHGLLALLGRWRGSVWKACWKAYVLFLSLWYGIAIVYRLVLPALDDALDINLVTGFETVVQSMSNWTTIIPLQFLLGFYVHTVFTRWWDSLQNISFPDRFLTFVNVNLPGDDEKSVQMRRTFYRLINLQCVMCWKEISLKVRRRFPHMDNVISSGLMTPYEKRLFDSTPAEHGRWMIPTHWMTSLIAKCYTEGIITDYGRQELTKELLAIRGQCGALTVYDWLNIPLVYLQVTKIATYGYFLFAVVSRQSISSEDGWFALLPVLTSLEFIFYIGWLKVGDKLLCPFGEDDQDFDVNYVLDRNIYVGNMMVNFTNHQWPSVDEVPFGGAREPQLPYTVGNMKQDYADTIPPWHFDYIKIDDKDAETYKTPTQLTVNNRKHLKECVKEGQELLPEVPVPEENGAKNV